LIYRKPRLLLAGEGSVKERGLRPLSKISPPLKYNAYRSSYMPLFEREIKGVSIGQQPNANGTPDPLP
jgi:hypothetical protein